METPLQSAQMAALEPPEALTELQDEHGFGGEHHIHMPNPSLWPLLTSIPIALVIYGLIGWTGGNTPWLSIIAVPFVLVGIIGWALQDPFAAPQGTRTATAAYASTYGEVETTGMITHAAEQVLQEARRVADQTVTISSTEWSAHPVNVEVEKEGVILALYGKVELEAQREELEKRLLQIPGVLDVRSFLVAEDALQNTIYAKIENLKEAGKLDGAHDLRAQVENYIVNLYGFTPTSEMKYMLEREIIAIPGVRVVVNHIGLDENIPGNLGKTNNKVGK